MAETSLPSFPVPPASQVGFTGTERGMSDAQKVQVLALLRQLGPVRVHHGDCVGADADFHDLAAGLAPRPVIEVHPPSDPKLRAFKAGDLVRPEKPYLGRNQDIVDACAVMIATPHERGEVLRSGTWATVRRARKAGRRVYVVWADGTVAVDN